jgi:hypothetical protein
MAPNFSDLAGITLLGILAFAPFVLLGAAPFSMLVVLGLVLAACRFCQSM